MLGDVNGMMMTAVWVIGSMVALLGLGIGVVVWARNHYAMKGE